MTASRPANRRPRFHRRKLIVDPKLQFELALRAAGFCTFVLIVLSIALFVPMIQRMEAASDLHSSGDMATVLLYMHANFWPVAGGCIVLALLGSIVQSHRIAGPLVRVKRHLRMIGEGRLPRPLRTRQRDYLKTEVELLNQMVHGIAEQMERMKNAEATLEQALDDCVRTADEGTPAEVRDAAARAVMAAAELRAEIHAFRWEDETELPARPPVGVKPELVEVS